MRASFPVQQKGVQMHTVRVLLGVMLLVLVGSAIGTHDEAFGADKGTRTAAASATPAAGGAEPSGTVTKALERYDRAFQSRDMDALKQIMANDVVMLEQGTQNIGRDDVLNNHLGPELRAFRELTATYSDVRIREGKDMALVTRQFAIRAMNQNGQRLQFRGVETQGWTLQTDRWELAHIHLSFSPR